MINTELIRAYQTIFKNLTITVVKQNVIIKSPISDKKKIICIEMLTDPEFMFYEIQEYKKILKNELPKQP